MPSISNQMGMKKSPQKNIKAAKEVMTQYTDDELEELERYIEELSTFLPLPFCIINPSEIIINVNLAFCNLTGYNDLEIIGEPISYLFENKKDIKNLEEKILSENLVKGYEMNLITKNKTLIIVNVSGCLRKDLQGNIIGYFLAFSDISELKRFQKELEEKVEHRTKQLEEKIHEMERFNKVAVGRELKMVELKQEVKRLQDELRKK